MEGRPLLVTAALIINGDQVLIAQRLPNSKFEPNKWEFPGGKVDFGEHPKESLKRELKEELDIVVDVGSQYTLASHVYDQNGMVRHVVILFYRCSIQKGAPKPLDCQDLKWVTREQLKDFIFVEGDNPVVKRILDDDILWD
jgi:8-oxo-dGTP diphosphatase